MKDKTPELNLKIAQELGIMTLRYQENMYPILDALMKAGSAM